MPDIQENRVRDQDIPASEESTSSKTKQLQELVNFLASNYQETSPLSIEPERKVASGRDLKLYGDWLEKAHTYFRDASLREMSLTLASEWVLDNYYVIRQALIQIGEDLPAGYYRRLPKLADGPMKGLPRIHAIAHAVLSFQKQLINVMELQSILIQVQERVSLTMGELWALPIFLRYNLIETLAHQLEAIIRPQPYPALPMLAPALVGVADFITVNSDDANETAASGIVANIILSLRTISEQNWNEFFESVSSLEATLRQDPAGIYPWMDFKTRDLYRKEIENLALASGQEENRLAKIALDLARETGREKSNAVEPSDRSIEEQNPTGDTLSHIGEYLLGKSRALLEQRIGYQPDFKSAAGRWANQHASTFYLSSIFVITLMILGLAVLLINPQAVFSSGSVFQRVSFFLLLVTLLVPGLTVSSSLVNWLITLWIKPRILPKLNFADGIPEAYRTLVVIPALITTQREIDSLVRQLEMNYLRNQDAGLLFALLTDFSDAAAETLPDDDEMVRYASNAIKELNLKYGRPIIDCETSTETDPSTLADANSALHAEQPGKIIDDQTLFYLLHRKRLWNSSEGKWMGWERKRGKLHELNQVLRGSQDTSFTTISEETPGLEHLHCVRFVITLDADTILPRGAARRLAGTLAHPLNHAQFDRKTGRIVSGYTVLQPRMEIHPRSANYSWFTRIFAGDTGLDLYTLAVSDAYQDLFAEGSYVGKGIYDVDGFERSVDRHIPENRVLSHDLLEGILGRAGLVTDITMVEDYPLNYYVQAKRQQRWIRGDWQLLPWLIHPGKFLVKFKAINRWKVLDNLLRSMLSPALMLIFFLGIISMPGLTWFWIAIILISLGIPVLTSLARSTIQTLGGESIGVAFHSSRWSLARWFLAMAFLPYDAYNSLDAILTTLYRLMITHRNLLQWTTAAQTANLLGLQVYRTTTWLRMIASTLMSLILISAIQLVHSLTGNGNLAPSLTLAVPIILLWMFSPIIDQQISLPVRRSTAPLGEEQVNLFRQVARRTWGFFERFVGPDDHWLPPDHYQESPGGIVAHRTSPTNIGLLFTSTLAAYDLGYLDLLGLATRLSITMDTLNQMERYRGHFFNWYDTQTLQPLNPRYISTIDSGNLAACLIITAQACRRMPRGRIFRWALWQGYLDSLSNLTEVLKGLRKAEFGQQVGEISQLITHVHEDILAVRADPNQWYSLFETINGVFWPDLSSRLIELVTAGSSDLDLENIRKLQEVASQVERHHQAINRTLSELVPWIQILEQVPAVIAADQYSQELTALRENLPYNPRLGQIHTLINAAVNSAKALRLKVNNDRPNSGLRAGQEREALDWLDTLDQAITQTVVSTDRLMDMYDQIATRSEQLVMEMDFKFLYHSQRRVFHNGYNLDSGQLDNNYYDLLASEARIASIIALAKGEVPQSHWLQLSRPMTRVEGKFVLLSWSATMFEYLMPPLFLRSYPGTLLSDSAQGAILHQIAYGKTKGVPWGISESGFYLFDANQNYQYRAFGVPGLGFKRGLGDDLVVSPYASMMALNQDPNAVAQNLTNLIRQKSLGLYGLFEAIDYTSSRLPAGDKSIVVNEYMSHHQGMIMMSLVNYFNQDIMVQRMHSDPRIQSVELLLQEQVPQTVPLQNTQAEDVKGLARLSIVPVKIDPWSVPVQTSIPLVSLLSNGNFGCLLSNMGSGYSTWNGIELTRWQADGVLDPWGSFIYIQEINPSDDSANAAHPTWSAGFQPIPARVENFQVTFFPHMAVYRRIEKDITSTMEVTVCPDDPVEVRRIHLSNSSDLPHNLRLTSYGEVILTQQSADRRHPAFNKLFIESEYIAELNLQIFWRRLRSGDEKPVYIGHMLVLNPARKLPETEPAVRHEADRNRFIGRGHSLRNPSALEGDEYLTGTTGATLDPIFALGQEIQIGPHENAALAYLTFAGESREEILSLARRYSNWSLIDRSFHQANLTSQAWLGKQDFNSQVFRDTLHVLSSLIYPSTAARASFNIIAMNRLGQAGLWRFGISGDHPIILIEIVDPKQIDLVREVLKIHEFLRSRRFMADVVIINHQRTDYGAELNGMLYRLVNRLNSEQWLAKRGGIFILYADQINPKEYALLKTAAGFLFHGEHGSLSDHIPDFTILSPRLPDLLPTRTRDETALLDQEEPLPNIGNLQFFNGYGGFSSNGREYVIELPPGKVTPAPWINVIAYPHFGFMVSENGSQCTWAINSGENRLTPWSNDPVFDPTGEAFYLRDEETGEVWSPTPLPAGADQPYRVTHCAGYTVFEHNSHGLRQRLTLFASPEDPVKIIHLRVQNTWKHNRRITATQYVEWVLGITHSASIPYLIPEYDASEFCMLVTNPYNAEFGQRTAFLIANKPVHGLTTDRAEFLGRGGSYAHPDALRRIGLETKITPNEDLCGALQLHLDLRPGETEEIYFVLGQGNDKKHALELAKKYHESAFVGAALEHTRAFWNHLLNRVQVHTPDPAMDLILNHWMLYQSLSCRLWGRSAFYQPSGAFGFRDQLQDSLALLDIDPSITRGQILNAARHQFTEGDVMHWWHPPSGRGVRTRISDDLLWLPYVVAHYVETTGDFDILAEKIPFLHAPPLREDEIERYNDYPDSTEGYTLLEHCSRAIEKGASKGLHGLPLIGTGDWNDALNKVGQGGKGESVWLAWFLVDVLERLAKICDRLGEADQASYYRSRSGDYISAIEVSAWDGDWYRRGYYDDGFPLGSRQNMEGQIDSIAQSWALLSGAGELEHGQKAMTSVLERLVLPQDRLVLLFTPPFDKTDHDPGYIKGYLPGIRENGGQYTHAAIWTAWAFTILGDGKQAGELFNLMNPIYHADSADKVAVYRVEPYVISSDVYSRLPYVRRGGWTWYTGSASWMYRLGINAILGFKKNGDTLHIEPCIPPSWDGFEIRYKYLSTHYHIQVSNPQHVARNVQSMILDGQTLEDKAILLVDDEKPHSIEVVLGENSA